MLGDPELKKCKEGDIIQLQRRGFFRVDRAYAPPSSHTGVASPVVLFEIPDGHQTKEKTVATIPVNKKTVTNNSTPASPSKVNAGGDLNSRIVKQGNLVRDLKGKKADKSTINNEVQTLLALKAEYKAKFGKDWTPDAAPPPAKPAAQTTPASNVVVGDLNERISKQGQLVRELKAQKAEKAKVDAEVKILLALKTDFKAQYGKDWTPDAVSTSAPASVASAENDLNKKIVDQGNTVRDLKTQKAEKAKIDAEVKALLALKAEFKAQTGKDWTPNIASASVAAPVSVSQPSNSQTADDLNEKITKQGQTVRDLKAQKAEKATIDAAVKTLLALKGEYKTLTGKDWKPDAHSTASKAVSVTRFKIDTVA